MDAVRIFLGLLSLFFAHFLGRSLARLHRLRQPYARALTWILRTAVCLAGVLWSSGLDRISMVTLGLAALSLAAGVYVEIRPRHVKEIHLFPPKE